MSSQPAGGCALGTGRAVLPNAVSVFRGLLLFPILYYIVSVRGVVLWEAAALLALGGLTDGLDGWLARRLGAESRAGRILDPAADKILVDGTAAALWIAGRIPGWLAAIVIARDLVILGMGAVLWRRRGRVPQSNLAGKIALVVLVATLAAYLLNAGRAAALLKWMTLAAVCGTAVSYGREFLEGVRASRKDVRP